MWKYLLGASLMMASPELLAQKDKCGVAGYIFKDKSMLSSATRFLINITTFPISTLGMSFGTSNCSKHKLVLIEKESLHLATMNYDDLKLQMASGHGEQIGAYAASLGCGAAVEERFTKIMRQNYSTIYRTDTVEPYDVLQSTRTLIRQDPVLASQCRFPQV